MDPDFIEDGIDWVEVSLMRNVQSQWEPGLAEALFRGLHTRFEADPGISRGAARFFADNVRDHLGISL